MIKNLKNTTGSDIFIADVGVNLPANSTYTIPPQRYWYWTDSVDIDTHVNSGSVIVNDGDNDLISSTGLTYLKQIFPSISDNVGIVIPSSVGLKFVGAGISITESSKKIASVNVDHTGGGSILSRIWHVTFSGKGASENAWLSYYGTGNSGDKTQCPIPWNSKIVGLSFSTKKCDTNTDVEIYVAAAGTGTSPLIQAYVWEIRNARTATKVIFPTPINFGRGDKIGTFFRKVSGGQKPQNCDLTIFFQITDESLQDTLENYCSDFSVGTRR
jgi:hypothetical protein